MRQSLTGFVLATVFVIPAAFGEASDRMLELAIRLDRHGDMGMAAIAGCNRELLQEARHDWWETIREIHKERKKADISDREDLDGAFIYSLERYHQLRVDYAKACTSGKNPAPPEISQEIVSPGTLKAEMEPLMSELRLTLGDAANPCLKKTRLESLRKQLDDGLQHLKRVTDALPYAPQGSLPGRLPYYDLAFEAIELRNQVGQALQGCP